MTTTQTTKKNAKKPAPPKVASEAAEKALVVSQPTASLPSMGSATDLEAWGVTTLTAKDVVIPKILPMQAMSKKVTAGECKFGDLIDSLTNEVLGDQKKPIQFVPFFMEKVFVVMEEKDGKFEFANQVPIKADNEGQEFEGVNPETKVKQKWYRTLNFYVLFPNQVENNEAIPYLLSFRSTSARAGQKLATTMFMKNLKAGKTPASTVMELSIAKKQNDKGTFMVLDVKEVRASTQAEVNEAFAWVKTVKANRVKVDHSDLADDATTAPHEREATPSEGAESNEY